MKVTTKKTKISKKQSKIIHHTAPHAVLFMPTIAVLWGIFSCLVLSSLLYSLCFYPSRDICSSPLDWLTILPLHELLLVITVGLPAFFAVLFLKSMYDVSFNTIELWWTVLAISSIVFAYLIITAIHGILLFLRKNKSNLPS